MNDLLATIFTGIIIDENEKTTLSKNGQTFGLSKSKVNTKSVKQLKDSVTKIKNMKIGSLHKFLKAVSVITLLESLLLHERFRCVCRYRSSR